MKKTKITGLHKAALAALFAVGNTLIRYPWRADEIGVPMLFLLSVVCALIPAFLLYPLFRRLLRQRLSGHRIRFTAAALLSFGIAGYALFCAYRCSADYLSFVRAMILPESNVFASALLFLAVAGFLAKLSDQGVDNFALLCFVAVLFCVGTLFLFGIPLYQKTDWLPKLPALEADLLSVLPTLLWECFLPLTVLAAYFALVIPRGGKASLAIGTAVGCGVLLLCVLQALLTFGSAYAAELEYPYSYAVRVLSVGQYFFRLEGFSYVLDYAACMLRTSVCLATARRLLRRFFPQRGRFFLPISLGAIWLLICLLPA